jgi:CMP-N-acetylneuraminic acid synthetase
MRGTSPKPEVVIPARYGSKRVPKKNIRLLEGEPVIGHTIRLLQEMNLFSKIAVSTESEEIAKISREYGAEVNTLRRVELSSDFVSTLSVVQDFLTRDSRSSETTPIFCVYPFAVFLTREILSSALSTLHQVTVDSDAGFVVPFKEYQHPIQRSFRMNEDNRMIPNSTFSLGSRTQDLEKSYFDSGQFYLAHKKTWLEATSIFTNVYGLILDVPMLIDIDSERDWKLLELFWHLSKSK